MTHQHSNRMEMPMPTLMPTIFLTLFVHAQNASDRFVSSLRDDRDDG